MSAGGRQQKARIRFVSPVLDEQSRLVRVVAVLDNKAGLWRAGEPVQARDPDRRRPAAARGR